MKNRILLSILVIVTVSLVYSLIRAWRIPAEIRYIDRSSGKLMKERIPGSFWLKWLNTTRLGRMVSRMVVEQRISSVGYGKLMDLPLSRLWISGFIRDHAINMEECQFPADHYQTFNQFFYRHLKPESRPIDPDPKVMVSPADGKVAGWQTPDGMGNFFVKGHAFTLDKLLHDHELADHYRNGTIYIIRLAPPDYHRYHFPVSGLVSAARIISGRYASVSPLATRIQPSILSTNQRQLTRISSPEFGKVIMIDVGATFVGSIIQTYTPETDVTKGMEKGYFKFGGSTLILLIEPGRIRIDPDIARNTQQGYETSIRMGESIGRLIDSDIE